MKVAFHYLVKAKIIVFKENDDIEFQEFEEIFEHESPIIAREQAIARYQSFIEVLLESKNKKYINDRETREELKSFYNPEIELKIFIGGQEIDFNGGYGFGIGVFMVTNQLDPEDEKWGNIFHIDDAKPRNREYYIHGIGYYDLYPEYRSHMYYLIRELDYYEHFKYDTNENKTMVPYYMEEVIHGNEPFPTEFLKTPFDWAGFDQIYWWGEVKQLPETIEELISNGESNQVEFKPALLYNFKTKNAGIGVKGIIAKAICAFLNSKGGFLIIGVSDDGEIQGLDHDFQLAVNKDPKDFFRLEYDQMLEHFLSFSVKNNVTGDFYKVEGKEIFVVTVTPSKRRPIFLKGQDGKEFYVRGEASSRKITDIEDLSNYCLDRFSNQ